MTAKQLKPLPPQPHVQIVVVGPDRQAQMPVAWIEWFKAADALMKDVSNNLLGPLTNAANDAAAAAAGVPIGGLYRTANAVQVRLV